MQSLARRGRDLSFLALGTALGIFIAAPLQLVHVRVVAVVLAAVFLPYLRSCTRRMQRPNE